MIHVHQRIATASLAAAMILLSMSHLTSAASPVATPSTPTATPTTTTNSTAPPVLAPTPVIPCCGGSQVDALYITATTSSMVTTAVNEGWSVADVAGEGTQQSPYTQSINNADGNVMYSCLHNFCGFTWLSFWTVSGPSGSDTWYGAGHAAGSYAARELKTVSNGSGIYPNDIVIDTESYNQPTSHSQYSDIVQGFADGINQANLNASYSVGFYDNQNHYNLYNLASIGHEAFVAINPILNNTPIVSGSNIEGWSGYYAACDSSNGSASKYVSQVNSFGAVENTLQFFGSGVDCGPS